MVATFSRCVVITHWLPHTLVQIFFRLILDIRKFGVVFPLWVYNLEFSLRLYE